VWPNLTHECVLELLKLSSNVNECKPLALGRTRSTRWSVTETSNACPTTSEVRCRNRKVALLVVLLVCSLGCVFDLLLVSYLVYKHSQKIS